MYRNKTVFHIISYSGAVIICKILGALLFFFVAQLLSPYDFGILVTLISIYSLTPIFLLGTVEAYLKKYSFLMGNNKTLQSSLLERHTLGSIWIASAILLLCEIILEITGVINIFKVDLWFIRSILMASVIYLFSNFYYFRFTAHQEFGMVSLLEIFRSIFSFIFMLTFVYLWGVKGAIYGYCIHESAVLISSVIINKKKLGSVSPLFDTGTYSGLIKAGLPISMIWWTYMAQSTLDKIITATLLGQESAGIYGLGSRFISILILIPLTLGRILYPKINYGIGQNKKEMVFKKYIMFPVNAVSLIIAPGICSVVIILPMIYETVFTKYADGVFSAQILLTGCYFICINRTGMNYLISINKQNRILRFISISLIVNIILSFLFAKSGFGINGIAFARFISLLLFSLWLWNSVFYFTGIKLINRVTRLSVLYTPLIISMGIIVVFSKILIPIFSNQNIFIPFFAIFSSLLCFSSSLLITPFKSTLKEIIDVIRLKGSK